jgi:hypothetical protein
VVDFPPLAGDFRINLQLKSLPYRSLAFEKASAALAC